MEVRLPGSSSSGFHLKFMVLALHLMRGSSFYLKLSHSLWRWVSQFANCWELAMVREGGKMGGCSPRNTFVYPLTPGKVRDALELSSLVDHQLDSSKKCM